MTTANLHMLFAKTLCREYGRGGAVDDCDGAVGGRGGAADGRCRAAETAWTKVLEHAKHRPPLSLWIASKLERW